MRSGEKDGCQSSLQLTSYPDSEQCLAYRSGDATNAGTDSESITISNCEIRNSETVPVVAEHGLLKGSWIIQFRGAIHGPILSAAVVMKVFMESDFWVYEFEP